MPQTHALPVPTTTGSRTQRLVAVAAAILAAALLTLALVQGIGSDTPASDEPAVSVPQAFAERPDESVVAAAVGGSFDSTHFAERPDESVVAAAIGESQSEGPQPFGGARP
jgi:hypothetical protein